MDLRSSLRWHAAAALVVASPASAQSSFDGRWRIDLAGMARPPRIETVAIADGRFRCATCTPPYAVPADGAFHPTPDQDEHDETAIRIVDARTVARTNRWKGRVVREETRTLAPGGASAEMRFTDTINAGVAPVRGRQTLTRTAPAPAGAHALSGTWRVPLPTQVSENALTQTLRIDGDVLTMRTGEGFAYVARLDGTPAPAWGDPLVDTVSVRRIGPRELVEVDSGKGKPVARFGYVLSPDGRTLTITSRHEASGRVTTMTARRM